MTEPQRPTPPPSRSPGAFAGLALALGGACAACLVPLTKGHEGKINTAQRDQLTAAKMLNICYGDTHDVRAGERDTDAQCDARLQRQLVDIGRDVLACSPELKARPQVLGAVTDFAYNVGPTAYCHSTVAVRFHAGDIRGGCDAMLAWDKAGGHVVAGLARRRRDERALCLRGVAS